MYNVRNISGKDLAIMLEKGGVILRPNKHIDLDQYCSRKWVKSNHDLRKLLSTGYLQLVHDSNTVLPKAPVKPIIRANAVEAAVKRVVSHKEVEVIDLVSFPDVEIDDVGRLATSIEPPVVVPVAILEPEPIQTPVLDVASDVSPAVEEQVGAPVELPVEVSGEQAEVATVATAEPEKVQNDGDPVFGNFEFNKFSKNKKRKSDFRTRK